MLIFLYEDHFTNTFDGLLCQENDLSYSFDFGKSPDLLKDEIGSTGNAMKVKSLDELDPNDIGILCYQVMLMGPKVNSQLFLSKKFMEHDACCMFDALMNGANGLVAIVEFFLFF